MQEESHPHGRRLPELRRSVSYTQPKTTQLLLEKSKIADSAARLQERAKRNQGEGKLGKQLEAQKRQTVNATLEQVSKENRAARDADAAAEARQWR